MGGFGGGLKCFKAGGTAQMGAGDLVAGRLTCVAFQQSLDAGAGGYVEIAAQSSGSAPKVGCRIDQGSGTATLRAGSFGVSSITDGATGVFTVNFTTAFADTNYIVLGSVVTTGNREVNLASRAVGSCVANVSIITTLAAADENDVNLVMWGN